MGDRRGDRGSSRLAERKGDMMTEAANQIKNFSIILLTIPVILS